MEGILDIFASNVYNDQVMKNELPAYVYQSLKKTIEQEVLWTTV